MKKIKLMLVAFMAMLGMDAFAQGTNLTEGKEQTKDGIRYSVVSVYKTEAEGKINAVKASLNGFSGATISIPDDITFHVKGKDDDNVDIDADVKFKVTKVGSFKDLASATAVELGANVAEIDALAFSGTSITDLDLTTTKLTVLNKLFEDANGKLKTVKLPATLTEIAANAFLKCGVLNSVDFTLATKLKIIGNAAFATTPSLTTLDLSKCAALVYFTADGLVKGTNVDVTPFTAGDTTTNDYLTTLTLPTTTKYIGTALKNCKVLATLNLDKTAIEGLAAGSLTGLDAITELELPASCLNIAATGKTGLTSLKINGKGTATQALTLGATSFTMAANADVTITLAGIDYAAITDKAIVGPTTSGKNATVTVGDIAATADLSAAAALVDKNVKSFTIGAIALGTANDFNVQFFGQAAKIVFGGNITQATGGKNIIAATTANAALTEIDLGTIAITDVAGVFKVGAFDESTAANLAKISWNPATAPTTKVFDVKAFGSKDNGRSTTVAKSVKFSTSAAVAALYAATLLDVDFTAPSASLDPIKVANNGTGDWYYAAYNPAGDSKIAAKQGDATVIVYAAYINTTEPTKVYHEQLRIIEGYYFIPAAATTGVIVKSTSDADVQVKSATIDATHNSMPYFPGATAPSHNEIKYVAGAKLGTEINALSGDADHVVYALSKITKNNLAWKTVPASASATNWFYIIAPKTATEIAADRLQNVWLDGSEPDDDATAIKTVKSAKAENGAIFNLAGQKVNASYKGVVIKDGKKYIQK